MTPDQIALVQRSFRDLIPFKDLAAKSFYDRLFALDPSIRIVARG